MFNGFCYYRVDLRDGDAREFCTGTDRDPALEALMLIAEKRPELNLSITREFRFPTKQEQEAMVKYD